MKDKVPPIRYSSYLKRTAATKDGNKYLIIYSYLLNTWHHKVMLC